VTKDVKQDRHEIGVSMGYLKLNDSLESFVDASEIIMISKKGNSHLELLFRRLPSRCVFYYNSNELRNLEYDRLVKKLVKEEE
jgi:hypothetical protein